MKLRSRVLAEVESGDPSPGTPAWSPIPLELAIVPAVSVTSRSSATDTAGTNLSHPDTAGLMGAGSDR